MIDVFGDGFDLVGDWKVGVEDGIDDIVIIVYVQMLIVEEGVFFFFSGKQFVLYGVVDDVCCDFVFVNKGDNIVEMWDVLGIIGCFVDGIDQKLCFCVCGFVVGCVFFVMDIDIGEVGGQMVGNNFFDFNVCFCLVVMCCFLCDVRDLQLRKLGFCFLVIFYCGFCYGDEDI